MRRLVTIFRSTLFLYSAQLFSLLLGWLVTKLNVTYLTVDEFGQFNFFITFINATFIFFTFGIFEASSRLLALSESPEKSRQLMTASLMLTLGMYALFSGFFFLSKSFLTFMFSVDISRLINQFFPLAGIYLLYDYFQKIHRGTGKIGRLSWLMVSPRILYCLLLIGLAYFQQFHLGQSVLLNLVSIALVILVNIALESFDFLRIKDAVIMLLREVRRFGLNMYGAELTQSLLFHLDKLFIAYFMDAEQLAYYSLAFTITMPLSLFSTSLSTTLYRKFSRENSIDHKILQINLLWIVISLIILIFLGSWIVERLFSPQYAQSIPVLLPMAVAFGLSGQSKIYSYFLMARGEGRVIRNISFAILLVNLVCYVIFIPWLGIMGAAIARVITFLVDVIMTVHFYRISLIKK